MNLALLILFLICVAVGIFAAGTLYGIDLSMHCIDRAWMAYKRRDQEPRG